MYIYIYIYNTKYPVIYTIYYRVRQYKTFVQRSENLANENVLGCPRIYIYIYIHTHTHIYIYIYTVYVYTYICMYTYAYIYMYRERERKTDR